MSFERTPHNQLEAGPYSETSQAYQMVDTLTSDVMFSQVLSSAKGELADNPSLSQIDSLEARKLELTKESYTHNDVNEVKKITKQIDAVNAELEQLDPHDRAKYRAVRDRVNSMERYGRWEVNAGEFEAGKLLELLKPQAKQQNDAPFAEHSKNNEQVWAYVPDEDIADYLDKRFFWDTQRLSSEDREANKIRVSTKPGDEVAVPLDFIVDASGFESWRGRSGPGSGKHVSGKYQDHYDRKINSYDVIKHYAALPTDLPPVSEINLYVQPNGIIFGDNSEGDSHRIAAAILRGDTSIKAQAVTFRTVSKNYIQHQAPATESAG